MNERRMSNDKGNTNKEYVKGLWSNNYPLIKSKYGERAGQDPKVPHLIAEKEHLHNSYTRNVISSKNSWDQKPTYFNNTEIINANKGSASASKLKTHQSEVRREEKFINSGEESPNINSQGFGSLFSNKLASFSNDTQLTVEKNSTLESTMQQKQCKQIIITNSLIFYIASTFSNPLKNETLQMNGQLVNEEKPNPSSGDEDTITIHVIDPVTNTK